MPGRNFSASSYRYGFNGKENDPETGTQDYGMRIYDNRLGRFLSVDPLFKSFAYKTPYDFAENTPIMGIDLDGGEEWFFMIAREGWFGTTVQEIVRDVDKGSVKSAKKFVHGMYQTSRLASEQATDKEYVNAVIGITAQTLYVNAPAAKHVVANHLAKSKNKTLNAVGQNMKALAKEDADVNKAFKEGNTEKISEVVTDVGILVATMVVTEGITAYCAPAEAVIIADEAMLGNSVGAARLGYNKLTEINKLIAETSETWGNLECVEWAIDFSKGLDKLGLPHDFVAIQSDFPSLWSATENKIISTNGYHEAVEFSGKIYDNIHTTGVSYEEWFNDFSTGVGGKIKVVDKKIPVPE